MKTNLSTILLLVGLFFAGSSNYAAAQEDAPVSDKDIKVVHFEELNYPQIARVATIQGIVVIRVILDDRGNVVKAVAISGKEPLIDNCLANVKKWKFQPNARKMAVIVYSFTLRPADCGSVASRFMLIGANFATVTSCLETIDHG